MAEVEERQIFENQTAGFVGAIKIDRRGDRRSISVAPGDRVELNDEEQQATAESHRDPRGNPFIDQDYEIRDMNSGMLKDSGRRPPLRRVTERRPTGADQPEPEPTEEVGAAVEPTGDAPGGGFAPGEEVGTPEAPSSSPHADPPDSPLATAQDIGVRNETG